MKLAGFRERLQLWLGGAAVCLLILQMLMLVWLMQPLRKVSQELGLIESGARNNLGTAYPAELLPVDSQPERLAGGQPATPRTLSPRSGRSRAQPEDTAGRDSRELRRTGPAIPRWQEQLERIEATVEYQLQRAGTFGRSPLAAPVDLLSHRAQSDRNAEQGVSRARTAHCALTYRQVLQFIGDAADLMEILGNLGDNACKWCKSRVQFSASLIGTGDSARLMLHVDDDGPGIPAELRARVLQRGGRLDTQSPGQGLGLAMVREMVVEVYQGELELTTSPLGGARISCIFPGRGNS